MSEKLEKIKKSVENVKNKEQRILFFLPEMPQASGGIAVVYKFAKILTENGYKNTSILHQTKAYTTPKWLGDGYENVKHTCLETEKLSVGPEDFLIIPEGFGTVMDQSKNLPCKRIVLAQSWYYILNTLQPGISWANYGITDSIVVNSTLETYVKDIFNGQVNVTVCRPSIPSYFSPNTKPKKPIVAISSRDQIMGHNLIKHFYLKYPQYKWITFKDMHGLSREEFADTLKECFLGVWVDKIAGFGTFPIECAKTNTPFIGLVPDVVPEYAKENSGVWTQDLLQIPNLIGQFIKLWMEDSVPQELLNGSSELAKGYTEEQELANVLATFESYGTDRIIELNEFILNAEQEKMQEEQIKNQLDIQNKLKEIEKKFENNSTEVKAEVSENK